MWVCDLCNKGLDFNCEFYKEGSTSFHWRNIKYQLPELIYTLLSPKMFLVRNQKENFPELQWQNGWGCRNSKQKTPQKQTRRISSSVLKLKPSTTTTTKNRLFLRKAEARINGGLSMQITNKQKDASNSRCSALLRSLWGGEHPRLLSLRHWCLPGLVLPQPLHPPRDWALV